MIDQWFVCRTKQSKEPVAAVAIAAEGFQSFYPVTLVERSHAGKRERVSRPLFPRYVFLRGDARDIGRVKTCHGVADHHAVMSSGTGKPIPVPDAVIDGIRDRERSMLAKAGEVKTGYQPGDTFRVHIGPWAQLEARYVGEDKGEVLAFITLFGMDHLQRLPFEAVPTCENLIDRISA